MSTTTIETSIAIDRPPEIVFRYVTVPARWHEWHPASESATGEQRSLRPGERFEEWASIRPLGRLPLVLRRHIRYRVALSVAPTLFEVTGESEALDLSIRYDLAEKAGGTLFERRLTYATHGWLALVEPFIVRPTMRSQSERALANLKRVLEERGEARGRTL